MRSCLKAGFGITFCPVVSIDKALARGELSPIHCSGLDDATSVIMIRHSQKWCSPVLTAFLTLAESMTGENAG